MASSAPFCRSALIVLAALVLSACSPRQMVMHGLADELASQGSAPEDDLDLAREASAYHLKLSESVLRGQPDHAGLRRRRRTG